jgi:hypothetical protein
MENEDEWSLGIDLRELKRPRDDLDNDKTFGGSIIVELYGSSKVWGHSTLYCTAARTDDNKQTASNKNREWAEWKLPQDFEARGKVAVFLRPGDWRPRLPKLKLTANDQSAEKSGWRTFCVTEVIDDSSRLAKIEQDLADLKAEVARMKRRKVWEEIEPLIRPECLERFREICRVNSI